MFAVGDLVVYGGEGVCRVEKIGPSDLRGADKAKLYYTLLPLYRTGQVLTPVDTRVLMRPILTEEEALALVDRLYRSSKDMERLCAEWVTYMRNLMILHTVADPGELVVAAPQELEQMRAASQRLGLPAILHIMEVLQAALHRLRGGVSRRVEMEMAVLRLCDPKLDDGTAALMHRLDALEARVKAGVPAAPAAVAPAAPVAPAEPMAEPVSAPAEPVFSEPPAEAAPPEPVLTESAEEQSFAPWAEVLEQLRQSCPPLYGVLSDSTALLKDGALVICTENVLFTQLLKDEGNKRMLAAAIQQVTGTTYRMKLRRTQQVQKPENDPLSQLLAAGRVAGIAVNEKE